MNPPIVQALLISFALIVALMYPYLWLLRRLGFAKQVVRELRRFDLRFEIIANHKRVQDRWIRLGILGGEPIAPGGGEAVGERHGRGALLRVVQKLA